MGLLESFYPESRFGGFTAVDGTIAFYVRVKALIEPSHVVVDVGCGHGDGARDPVPIRRELRTLRGHCSRVIGLDVDSAAASNPLIDEFRRIDGKQWPIMDSSVNGVVADWVLEHLEEPGEFFQELFRVLRTGGYFCARTPNLHSYFGLAAASVPVRFHQRARDLLQECANDVSLTAYPTFYRCNTRKKLQKALETFGFDALVCAHEPEPAYLSFSSFAYQLGKLHQQIVPTVWRTNLFIFARKRAAPAEPPRVGGL